MRPLSISNFSRRYIPLALFVLVWLLLLEFVFRIPTIGARFAVFEHEPLWYSRYVPDRLNLIRANPEADIWFVGASMVMQGFNPGEIDPALNQRVSRQHKSLNLGLPGLLDISYLEDYLVNVFLPEQQPDVMVLGVFPYIIGYSTKDYDALGGIDVATRNDSQRWDRRVGWWLYQNSALYRFSKTLNYAFFQQEDRRPTADATGFLPTDITIATYDHLRLIEPSGDGNSRLEMNLSLIQHLRDTLAARGIRLMIVNLPVYDTLIDTYPGGSGKFVEYQQRLHDFTAAEAISFCDAHAAFKRMYGDAPHPDWFQDYYHLNTMGANAVAPIVADFLAHHLETSDATPSEVTC